MTPPIEDCRAAGHLICEEGDFCFRCTWRTDQSFALHSRMLLNRIQAIEMKEAA